MSDSSELLKPSGVTDEELQNELSNLKDENETLRQELAKEKDNYGTLIIINRQLNQQLEEVRSQIEQERTSREKITNLAPITIGVESPEPAIILSQLRTKRRKSTASLADVEAILEILEDS